VKKLFAAVAFCFVVAACGQAPAEEGPAPAAVVCEKEQNDSVVESHCVQSEEEVTDEMHEKN
jgi:nitrous oxide reductase accessory protein NosL